MTQEKEHNTRMCFSLKSLKESAKKKMVVLVSHRVSTMNVTDVVYEMENGRIS